MKCLFCDDNRQQVQFAKNKRKGLELEASDKLVSRSCLPPITVHLVIFSLRYLVLTLPIRTWASCSIIRHCSRFHPPSPTPPPQSPHDRGPDAVVSISCFPINITMTKFETCY